MVPNRTFMMSYGRKKRLHMDTVVWMHKCVCVHQCTRTHILHTYMHAHQLLKISTNKAMNICIFCFSPG